MADGFSTYREAIATILDVDPSEVDVSTLLKGNEHWDSFARLSAVALVTKNTGKQLTVDDVSKLETVADLIELLSACPGVAR